MIEEIKKLKHGEKYTVPESDYGCAEVYMLHDMYFVFEIPQYGGIPFFSFNKKCAEDVVKEIESWT